MELKVNELKELELSFNFLNSNKTVLELVKDHWDALYDECLDYYGEVFGYGSIQLYEYGNQYSYISNSRGTHFIVESYKG